MSSLFDLLLTTLSIIAILVINILAFKAMTRAFHGYTILSGGLRLEAKFPPIFKNQQAQLLPKTSQIIYKSLGQDIFINIPNLTVIDIYPTKTGIFLFPILVYDVEFFDNDNMHHQIINISKNGIQELLKKVKEYQHIQINQHAVSSDYFFFEGTRFDVRKKRGGEGKWYNVERASE